KPDLSSLRPQTNDTRTAPSIAFTGCPSCRYHQRGVRHALINWLKSPPNFELALLRGTISAMIGQRIAEMDNPPEAGKTVLRATRIALVHDWRNQMGGAENVLEELVRLFPGAPVYTSMYDRSAMPASYRDWD